MYTHYNIEARSPNNFFFFRGKAISITYSECVSVALVIQLAKCTHRIILSPAACLYVPHFLTLSHKRHDFLGNVTEPKMCELNTSENLSETFLIKRKIQRDIVMNARMSLCNVIVILVRF
jgi:hypothetical protein